MAKSHSHDEQNTPEEDAALAREILADGDLPHAMFHLAGALASNPTNPEWLKLFDEIAGRSPDPPSLIPDSGQGFWHGLAACRARLLYQAGRRHDALTLMVQVIPAFPAQGYHLWAEEWAKAPGQLLDARPVFTLMGGLLRRYEGDVASTAEERAEIEKLFPLVDALCAKLPNDAHLQAFRGTLRRKAGRLDEAVEITGRAYKQGPGWNTAILAAGASMAKGDHAAARKYFKAALLHDPSDLSAHLDLGDMAAGEGDFEAALEEYEIVLAKEPRHAWAEPSAMHARWCLTQESKWLSQLRSLAENDGPARPRAVALLTDARSRVISRRIFHPREATLNSLNQIVASFEEKGQQVPRGLELTVGVTACEPPSLRLVARRMLPECKLTISAGVQTPDPRLPHGEVDFVLWRFEGTDPSPSFPPPPDRIATGISRIARSAFVIEDWKRYARSFATEELAGGAIEPVLAVMVHPPPTPDEMKVVPWIWVLRVQLAAALVLASLDGGWKDSRRRRALLSLARGPLDWSVTAAVVALTEVALACPESREEITAEFRGMLARAPKPGWTCWIPALLEGALEVPGLPPEDASRYREEQRLQAEADRAIESPEHQRRLREAASGRAEKKGCLGLLMALFAL